MCEWLTRPRIVNPNSGAKRLWIDQDGNVKLMWDGGVNESMAMPVFSWDTIPALSHPLIDGSETPADFTLETLIGEALDAP